MEQHETDWRTILLLIGAAGGAILAYGIAGLMVLSAGVDAVQPSALADGRSAFDFFVLAAAPAVIGTMFLPAIYYSIRRLLGRPASAKPVPLGVPGRPQQVSPSVAPANGPIAGTLLYGLIVALVWVGVAVLAGQLVASSVLKWITPPLYVLAILIPAGFFLWLATRGLNPGSPQRRWGVLAAGIGLGIAPAMLAELLLAFGALLVLVVFLALDPARLAAFEDLARQLESSNDINQVLRTAAPMLTSPIVLVLALTFFSGFSPFIEEITKSLATWIVFDRLTSPAQGFAIGAISGAAFGLVESLLVSATPDASWTTTLLIRGASTMMHIMSASLTGWGIGQFRATRRVLPLIGMYLAAMGLHGLWNGSVVAITVGTVRSGAAAGGYDLVGILLAYVGVAVLAVLCLAIPPGMWLINWRLRAATAPASPAGDRGETARSRTPEAAATADSAASPPAPLP